MKKVTFGHWVICFGRSLQVSRFLRISPFSYSSDWFCRIFVCGWCFPDTTIGSRYLKIMKNKWVGFSLLLNLIFLDRDIPRGVYPDEWEGKEREVLSELCPQRRESQTIFFFLLYFQSHVLKGSILRRNREDLFV